MKLNKNQLNVLYDVVAYSRSAVQFWNLVVGKDFDTGDGVAPTTCWYRRDVNVVVKSRCQMIIALRQLADALESNQVSLDPNCDEALDKAAKVEKKAKK